MKQRIIYKEPLLEVIYFKEDDIVVTSGGWTQETGTIGENGTNIDSYDFDSMGL